METYSDKLRELADRLDRDFDCHLGGVIMELLNTAKSLTSEVYKKHHLELESEEAVLAMAVARLEGEVEGRPTQRGNFLQRIDELVAKEKTAKR